MSTSVIARLRDRVVDPRRVTDEAVRFPSTVRTPVDEQSISRAEHLIGLRLPELLRDAYRFVGNGGYGPGYGLLRLLPDPFVGDVESVVGLYTTFRGSDPDDATWLWPAQFVPFCDWGCAIRSCVDCSSVDGAVVTFDPGAREAGDPMANAFATTHRSLDDWFADWLVGAKIWDQMFEDDPERSVSGTNPFTKQPMIFRATKLRRGGLT